jgi:hypothetical protein
MHGLRPAATLAVAAAAIIVSTSSDCATPAHSARVAASPPKAVATRDAAVEAPAAASVMVCEDEAAAEISAQLGAAPDQPRAHTWSDRVYTCRYHYPDGVLVVSVDELPDVRAAVASFAARRAGSPGAQAVPAMGEEAYVTHDGSIYARSHSSLLHVDVTGLPDGFGPKRLTRAAVGVAVASVILKCWSGS